MHKFRRALIILAIIAALSVGVLTTAFASEAADGGSSTAPTLTLEEAKAALEANTPLKQYDLPVVVNKLTWDAGTTEATVAPYGTTERLGVCDFNYIGPEIGEDGNGYFTIRYDGEAEKEYEASNSSIHTYAYIDVSKRTKSNNLVMEFDITTFSQLPAGFNIEHSAVRDAGGSVIGQPAILAFGTGGEINAARNAGKLSAEEKERLAACKIEQGKWTHFSIVYHSDTCYADIYIDYEFVCSVDTRDGNMESYNLSIFRFGTANPSFSSGELSIDNFIAYEGSYVRTPDLFDNMTEHDKFIFYSRYMINDGASTGDRIFSYNSASALLPNYYADGSFIPVEDKNMDAEELAALNARLEAAALGYNAFVEEKYAELYAGYIKSNLDEFAVLTGELCAMERTIASISDRKKALSLADTFLDNVGNDILMTEESGYLEVKQAYDSFVQNLSNDENIVRFCDLMDEFDRSLGFSPEAIKKHYDKAAEIVLGGIDRTVLGRDGYDRYTAAYARYNEAPNIIEVKVRARNAQKIVDCIGFIKDFDTVDEWDENYEYINKYVVIVRNEVRANNYDPNHEGVGEAIAFYNLIDEYFYGLLQDEHASVLSKYLDEYAATEGYVERVGICSYLRAYIAGADIDLERENIAPLVLRLSICESELEQYKVDYNEVLIQNTSIFASTVRLILTSTSYTERRALYEQARQLYFAMNVADESIAEELAIYDSLTEEFSYIDKASESFVLAVELLRAAQTDDDRFAALVLCYRYSNDAETDIDGVADAMVYYLEEYEAYNSGVLSVNDKLESISTVSIGSVRANCGAKEIVAVIVKKLGEE